MSLSSASSANSLNRSNETAAGVERRAALGLGCVYISRMLGLFMLLPVLSIYAQQRPDASAIAIGWAVGSYGLMQAILQIPFGLASDRFGRKPVLYAGLLLFVIGSVLCALTESVYGLIVGRALQGAGAISAVVMATAADLSREQSRGKVMALLGMSIGAAFVLSLVLGPLVAEQLGLDGLFWLTAGLGVASVAAVIWVVPEPPARRLRQLDATASLAYVSEVLQHPQLRRLNIGIFILHAIVSALFIAYPLALVEAGVARELHWQYYLGTLLPALLLMFPLVGVAEAKPYLRQVFLLSVALLVMGLALLWLRPETRSVLLLGLSLFFLGFTVLEALLPSTLSKWSPAGQRGTAMGVYASCQFAGAFVGGVAGGWLWHSVGISGIFAACALLAFLWWLLCWSMPAPPRLQARVLRWRAESCSAQQVDAELGQIAGIAEWSLVASDQMIYLKIDRQTLDEQALAKAVATFNGQTSEAGVDSPVRTE